MSRADQALVAALVFAVVVFLGFVGVIVAIGETVERIGQYQEQGHDR